ncbi:MAG: hypothetical protein DMF37_03155 [Verrucomicrobia bacterium]|nr:MAG: hypothetical protein DMF37_03155 [Verrucomicrobiota bacterium]
MTKEMRAIHEQLIRVVYPADGRRIALRTEHDWDTNVEVIGQNGPAVAGIGHPGRSNDSQTGVWEFLIETERPYFYFKPVLLREDGAQWSRGENFLAVATSGASLEVHPYFREDTHCSVCELMPPLASASGREHRFRVFLPPGYYENTLKKYPVLYMHDGHNLFFTEEAFVGNTWRADEVLNMLDKMNAIEEVIVVGIHPNDRMSEYTLPGYEEYGRFLVETLKPLIDAKYRTLAGPANAAVMGSSLGGVVSLYLAWQWPEVFGKVACLSSTFTFRDDLLERISLEAKRKIRIYLDSGWPELFYLAFPEAKHDENAWAARSPIPFQFLFGKLPAFGGANPSL